MQVHHRFFGFFSIEKSVHTPDKQGKAKKQTYFKELGPTSVNLL